MRIVITLGLLSLSLLFYCGDIKSEIANHIKFVTLEEVTEKMLAKEKFFLFVGCLDNVETQKGLERLKAMTQPIYFLDVNGVESTHYQAFAKAYNIRTTTHFAHFRGKYQFVTANILTVDLSHFLAY